MFFQSNKKKDELWRARVQQPPIILIQKILETAVTGATSPTHSNILIMSTQNLRQSKQQQMTQPRYQCQQMDMMTTNQQIFDDTSSTCPMICQQQQQPSMTTINNLMNYSGDRSDSSSMTDGQENSIGGYYYENSIESTTDYEEDQTMSTTTTSTTTTTAASPIIQTPTRTSLSTINLMRKSKTSKRRSTTVPSTTTYTQIMTKQKTLSTKDVQNYHQLLKATIPRNSATSPMNTTTNTSSIVPDWVRNCCGGNSCSTDSINCNQLYNNNNNNYNNIEKLSTYTPQKFLDPKFQEQQQELIASAEELLRQLCYALLDKVKKPQLKTLILAVKSRGIGNCSNNNNSTTMSSMSPDVLGHQPDCVLVPRTLIMGLEPNVIACLIWRWPDIQNSKELKSIASCRNEKDRIYACCNPSHWSRLLIPETPPPPYQLHTTERLKPEDHASNEITKKGENHTNDSIVDQKRDLRIQFPGSLTTENEDTSILSSSWCELAYWEFKQRVGVRFPVENSSVNIFFDQYRGDGMCLKTLAEQRQTATPDQVLKVRQKIGLGVTLSQEADGVWLYNRSSSPVFVHSPTLNSIDYWFHVTKVPPDYCLKAYDNYKAKTQDVKWPSQIAGAQTGPIDPYSMRISFAKGWGPKYTRQDVTACPCWLEVLLRR